MISEVRFMRVAIAIVGSPSVMHTSSRAGLIDVSQSGTGHRHSSHLSVLIMGKHDLGTVRAYNWPSS